MAQQGELAIISGSWCVRYYVGRDRKRKKLGRVSDYPTKDSIFPVFQNFMASVNKPEFRPAPGTLLRSFVLESYFPYAEDKLRGSTLRGYRAIWNNYVEPRLGHRTVRELRTFDCQKAMDSIIKSHPELKKASLFRVKSFMSAIFNKAIRDGLRDDDKNPVASPGGNGGIEVTKKERKRGRAAIVAYSLADIRAILEALMEPAMVIMAVAAYSGLRRGEIVGLKWEDYDGKLIHVRRNICFGQRGEMSVELTKTEASEAAVPVITPLRAVLDAWKTKAAATDGCWMFPASFTRKKDHPATLLDAARMTPQSPGNLLRDTVLPVLREKKVEWRGYHAFRRGLATNLRTLGVDDLTISEILRHSDVSVTRANYEAVVSDKAVAGMERLEAELAKPVRKSGSVDAVLPVSVA